MDCVVCMDMAQGCKFTKRHMPCVNQIYGRQALRAFWYVGASAKSLENLTVSGGLASALKCPVINR